MTSNTNQPGGNLDEIYKLAKNNLISPSIVEHLYNTISDLDKLKEIIESITVPPSYYYLRANLNKISILKLIDEFRLQFPEIKVSSGPLKNTIKIPITRNEGIPLLPKPIYTDKFAAESIMMGADLFIPGFRGMSNKFNKGEKVSIVLKSPINSDLTKKSEKDNRLYERFHVANGETMISSKNLPRFKNGILVKTTHPRFSIPDCCAGLPLVSGVF